MTVGALSAFVFSEPTLPLLVFPILLNFLDRSSGTSHSPFLVFTWFFTWTRSSTSDRPTNPQQPKTPKELSKHIQTITDNFE